MKNRYSLPERRWFLGLVIVGLIGAALIIATVTRNSDSSLPCSFSFGIRTRTRMDEDYNPTSIQLRAILHYATSRVVPQQSVSEIKISLDVLKSLGRPSKFLVFGLGHDSLMWASFNPGGTTLFLEEDPKWVQTILKDAPSLRAHTVRYRTQLREANALLSSYRSEPACSPSKAYLRGNEACKLALQNLPDEVYETEWDMIMIDAPKGYFAEAPGRMAAVFSAAVMARNRKGSGVTHVFLHDVDRKVEKVYAEEFLCKKNLVKGVGRLWHFEIPPSSNNATNGDRFC
ncbi:arabinogalactan O-methyltransferase 1-like [Gastrolobium bilobum]|uniref:arabinogalactan O-methyltransferase 1-like n=1 Tax=Gastrolobium bilobum TaxID=150636 RepID=UPI002AB1D06F|nr:arabinogalactan O-methyltransferase 1-like [Gastrolobium bilobum]